MPEIELIVQSILPSDEPQGRYHINIFPDSTVETLLRELCRRADVPLKHEYCLRSKGHDQLQRTAILSQIGVQDGAFLHWTFENVAVKIPCRCNTFWFLALISFIIGIVGLAAICVLKFKTSTETDYAIVFDAGSTHTAMFIYKWEGSKFNGTAVAVQHGTKCTAEGSGIANFANTPDKAGQSLIKCLTEAKKTIPKDKHSSTPIYLGATAGMRLLNATDPIACEMILGSICDTFSNFSFKFICETSVKIISGTEEGTSSWITSNYAANAFRVDRPDVKDYLAPTTVSSIGAMDLGGASTQITFVPRDQSTEPEFIKDVKLFGKKYGVYTHSYLCYGVAEVTKRILASLIKPDSPINTIEHPCLPKDYNKTMTDTELFASPCVTGQAGLETFSHSITLPVQNDQNYTFIGQSNSTECEHLIRVSLFNTSVCHHSRCSFNGVYQPEISGPFYAFSSFYYITNFLNLSSSTKSSFPHADLVSSKNKICNSTWEQLLNLPVTPQERENLMWYCLQSTYINLLLFEGYNFSEAKWPDINFVEKISSTEVGWSLGYILNESLTYPVDEPEVLIYTVTFALLTVLFCLFLIVSVALALQGRRMHNSKDIKYRKMSTYGAI
ncbi:ectonucleoside triphosphate diphosphohydrolase 2-like isoform X1 [Biomphalaria pfeifferi]|uniref:Ectonucleoside triphosphate diphosphohydrolase 2-like isoform X1 n=1 Tax=Biomphalaria pfeifferi TaxID=112525 RepID=A0AAD8BDU4_BIOPF|nr:ectonucleoside triphosphate diphosphohydrolase 2-like isoform X1 [Biomphalaria pfeifferi]